MISLTPVPELPPTARCRNCQSQDLLISGEGVVVCSPCIAMLGELANDPSKGTNNVLTALQERHGDVVHLNRDRAELRWEWYKPGWPGVDGR